MKCTQGCRENGKKGKIVMKQLVLASGSPRRIQMLKERGILARTLVPDVDESLPPNISVEQAVMYLALKKALYVESLLKKRDEEGIIIAADTVVYKDRIIGKPEGAPEARNILIHLRSSDHLVATGVAVIETQTTARTVFCEITKVFFTSYTDAEIEEYIATGEAYDKAGGYAIQGGFAPYIDHIEGDYDNVVGFPWTRICGELARMGYGMQ